MIATIAGSLHGAHRGEGLTYNLDFNIIKSVMELLISKGHIFIDALLSEATLPRVPLVWIPEYLAGLMKLSELSDGGA